MQPSFTQRTKTYISSHKKTSVAILLAVLVIAYFIFRPASAATENKYVVGTVQKGTIISSVSGSGQVEAGSQIDLKAKSGGTITYVGVKAGDVVKKGKTLFSIDARDAQRAVRSAQTNLETSQLSLEKFKQTPDTVDVLTIKKAIADAEQSKVDAQNDVKKAYRALLNSSTTPFSSDTASTQTPPTVSGTYTKDVEAVVNIEVRGAGNNSYFSVSSIPEGVVTGGVGIVSNTLPQAIGDSGLYIKFANNNSQPVWTINLPNKSATSYNSLYQAYQDAIENQNKANSNADLAIAQNQQKLDLLYTPDPLDLRAKELSVQQAQDTLLSAQETLSDYYITAPFDGTIASVTAKVGDTASGVLGTIITRQKVATISLNEVDISKIKLGQKVTMTFDAIQDLTMTGTIAEVDTLGTVTQGVVSYGVQIAFDTDNNEVKPGMTTSAMIITNTKLDVLTVPSSAIKSGTSGNYVEVFNQPIIPDPITANTGTISTVAPNKIPVEIGISDDTNTEIISGVKEGEQVVTRIITATAVKTTGTSAPSLLGGGGGATRGIGGGFGR